MTEIPLIDLESWFTGDEEARRALAVEVDAQLQRLGFLVVVNHGIAPEVMDTCRSEARAFFGLPAEAKERTAAPSAAYRGWIGPGLESNAATYGVDTPPDLKETWAYGPVDITDESLRETAPRWFTPNTWPDDPPSFRPAAEAWWREARRLADDLLDIMSVALGLPERDLRDRCRSTTSTGTLNWYYPGSREAAQDGQFRIGPHTDFGTLTILDRERGAGGLQVLDEAGRWIDAPWVEGGLTVNTGDLFRRWTNERWCSNEHRVLPPPVDDPAEELISLVFFHEPDTDAVIEPFASCVDDEHPAKYPPILACDYLAEKMDALVVP
ncbi:MAG: 2-oxoglutarate and iron-dependent oxygenase domain-containing protein [Actinomycetota bacterium]